MKKLLKLAALVQAARRGTGPASYEPWQGKKWKGRKHQGYGPAHDPYGHGPYAHRRPRGLKGMLVEAIVSRLFRR